MPETNRAWARSSQRTESTTLSISRPRSSCPISVRAPLGYYPNNTVTSRALIEAAVKAGVRYFISSSTAAVYGNPQRVPVARGRSHRADVALRVLEADERNHVARCRDRAWIASRHPALLQRRRR